MFDNSMTVMKFRLGEEYSFSVLDRWNEPDEVKRLDMMIEKSRAMKTIYGDDYEQLWIKTCPLFYIPPETKLPKLVR